MGLLPNGCSRMVTPFSKTSYSALGMTNWDDYKHVVIPGITDLETVNDMVRCTSSAYGIFPNLITPIAAYGFPFITFWPIDKQTTRIDWTHYAPIDFDPKDGMPANWQTRLDNFKLIMEEDFWNMAPMQKSLESPAMRGMPIRRAISISYSVSPIITASPASTPISASRRWRRPSPEHCYRVQVPHVQDPLHADR